MKECICESLKYIISMQSELTNLIQDKIHVQIKVYPLLLFEEIFFLIGNPLM